MDRPHPLRNLGKTWLWRRHNLIARGLPPSHTIGGKTCTVTGTPAIFTRKEGTCLRHGRFLP